MGDLQNLSPVNFLRLPLSLGRLPSLASLATHVRFLNPHNPLATQPAGFRYPFLVISIREPVAIVVFYNSLTLRG